MKRKKLQLEFIFRASPAILHKFIITPSCLVRWFCDEVKINDKTFTFVWEGYDEVAELLENVEHERIRFRWDEAESEDEYLEFNINTSPVTNETILEVIDFCDADEVKDQKQLWESQMKQLKMATGG